jgi:hypothetical protein
MAYVGADGPDVHLLGVLVVSGSLAYPAVERNRGEAQPDRGHVQAHPLPVE